MRGSMLHAQCSEMLTGVHAAALVNCCRHPHSSLLPSPLRTCSPPRPFVSP